MCREPPEPFGQRMELYQSPCLRATRPRGAVVVLPMPGDRALARHGSGGPTVRGHPKTIRNGPEGETCP